MKTHPQKVADLEFGFRKEKEVLPILNKFFNVNFKQNGKFAVFDFIDEKNKVIGELKSRRCNKHEYRKRGGIMIGSNKVEEGLRKIKEGYRVIFTWLFLNKYCYYELTEDFKEKMILKKGVMARNDRGYEEYSNIAYIPTKALKNILVL